MPFRIEETFAIRAPADAVFAYLTDPRRVVTCLPGAELTEVADERTFLGNVKLKVGPVTVAYKGRVHLTQVDEAARRVKMVGEGREGTGSGSAKMAMDSTVAPGPDGESVVTVLADVDVVGRAVQLGRGMMEQVATQMFRQFSTCVRKSLEVPAPSPPVPGGGVVPACERGATDRTGSAPDTGADVRATATSASAPPTSLARPVEPVRIVPVLFRALFATIGAFLRRLFGREHAR